MPELIELRKSDEKCDECGGVMFLGVERWEPDYDERMSYLFANFLRCKNCGYNIYSMDELDARESGVKIFVSSEFYRNRVCCEI